MIGRMIKMFAGVVSHKEVEVVEQVKAVGQTWEYEFVVLKLSQLETGMTLYGKDGWELVSACLEVSSFVNNGIDRYHLFFKRPA